jgi:hypothetical protein
MFPIKKKIWQVLRDWDWVIGVQMHRGKHGVFPNVLNPKTFNEKCLHRKVFDRSPLLAQVADKYAVRDYVETRLGAAILPKLYCVTSDPCTIPFDELPGRFVVKPTHGSGWVEVVADKSALNRARLIETCSTWLSQNYYEITREWVYKDIEPRILVEEFIDDGSGAAPSDFKFFVFHGRVEFIQIDAGRFTEHRRRLYSPAWQKLDITYEYPDIVGDVKRPTHLAEMIRAAEILGNDLDFIRADFYDTGDKLYFGELTTTPECCLGCFHPQEFDRYLGGLWNVRNLDGPAHRLRIWISLGMVVWQLYSRRGETLSRWPFQRKI